MRFHKNRIVSPIISIILIAILYIFASIAYVFPQTIYVEEGPGVKLAIICLLAEFILMSLLIIIVDYIERKATVQNPTNLFWKEIPLPINFKGLITSLVFILIAITYSKATSFTGVTSSTNQEALMEVLNSNVGASWFLIILTIIGPIGEELIFRKAFFALFFRKNNLLNHILAIVVSGLLFGLIHDVPSNAHYWVYAGSGMILAASYRFSRDIKVPIAVHIFENYLATILL